MLTNMLTIALGSFISSGESTGRDWQQFSNKTILIFL